jgi:hypothetical protein
MKHIFSADSVKALVELWPKRAFRRNYQTKIHSTVIQDFNQDVDDVYPNTMALELQYFFSGSILGTNPPWNRTTLSSVDLQILILF